MTTKTLKTYDVTVTTKYAVAGARGDAQRVVAENQADALKRVRKMLSYENDRLNPFVYTATKVADYPMAESSFDRDY